MRSAAAQDVATFGFGVTPTTGANRDEPPSTRTSPPASLRFATALSELLERVRTVGTVPAPELLLQSDLVLPYSDATHLGIEEHRRLYGPDAPLEFGHTMSEQVGGQLTAGFVITHLDEAPHHAQVTAAYMPGYYATRAQKPR